jgi:hypothetical protein
MYAPNSYLVCIHLWAWMETSLLDANQIIGRHFNMVEWDGDRGGGVGYMISGSEKPVWYKCKSSLHLFDPIGERKEFTMVDGLLYPNLDRDLPRFKLG